METTKEVGTTFKRERSGGEREEPLLDTCEIAVGSSGFFPPKIKSKIPPSPLPP